MCEEKENVKEQLAGKAAAETQTKESLITVQTRIASLTDQIENDKNGIIELLNNRASTKAKIQRYDTMLEQIQVRKSEMYQKMILSESEASEAEESLVEYEASLTQFSGEIIPLTE